MYNLRQREKAWTKEIKGREWVCESEMDTKKVCGGRYEARE